MIRKIINKTIILKESQETEGKPMEGIKKRGGGGIRMGYRPWQRKMSVTLVKE